MKINLKLIYLITLAAQASLYELTNKLNSLYFQKTRLTQAKLFIDNYIPFSPYAIWPYLLYYVLLLTPIFLTKNKNEFFIFLKSFVTISLVSDVTFVIFPVEGPRVNVDLLANDLSSVVLQSLYSIDMNTNCLPSLHSAHSLLIAYSFGRQYGYQSLSFIITSIAAILVVVATMVTKQHWVLDILLAFVIVIISTRLYGKSHANK